MSEETQPPEPLWSVSTGSKKFTTGDGEELRKCYAKLHYKGTVVHTVEGVTAEASLLAMAQKWNEEGYAPDMSSANTRCLADLPGTKARAELMKEWSLSPEAAEMNPELFQ